MKLIIKEKAAVKETEVEIRCVTRDNEVENIVQGIKSASSLIVAKKENGDFCQLRPSQILYFEALERLVYAYLDNEIVTVKKNLYELEEELSSLYFIRISKSTIVNVRAIKNIRPEDGRRIRLQLRNGEWTIVSKNYVSSLKKMIGMKGE